MLEEVAERNCGLWILGTTRNPTVHGPEQPDPVGEAQNRGDGLGDLQRSLSH